MPQTKKPATTRAKWLRATRQHRMARKKLCAMARKAALAMTDATYAAEAVGDDDVTLVLQALLAEMFEVVTEADRREGNPPSLIPVDARRPRKLNDLFGEALDKLFDKDGE